MARKDLEQISATFLVMQTELREAPELKHDEEFMRRYERYAKAYKHYNHHVKKVTNYQQIRAWNDRGVI